MRTKDLELMEKIKAFAEDYVLGTGSSPSTTKIAEAVGISRGTAYKYLVEMAGRGMIGYCGGAISTAATESSRERPHGRPLSAPYPAARRRRRARAWRHTFLCPRRYLGQAAFISFARTEIP